jgi:spore coat polysaccharide biosynthesis protein SpsF
LPGKVFLPVKGISLAVLAARRAANTGRKVIVITSHEECDDAFATMLKSEGLDCFRGSLDNTLERFVKTLSQYDEDTIVVRLTADNVFPDGILIDEMEEYFISSNLDYLCSAGDGSGLPYGVSVEIMRLSHLREAHEYVKELSDKEHVTPYIIRKYGRKVFQKHRNLGKEHYRCTVDSLEDYLAMRRVFEEVSDPVSVSLFDLIESMEKLGLAPTASKPSIPLIIGGAQLGFKYGISNQCGMPSSAEAKRLIKTGLENGVFAIDTASAYGDSEEVIGNSLGNEWGDRVRVTTKLTAMEDCPSNASAAVVSAFVESSVYRSCLRLGRNTLDCVLLHRVAHLDSWCGAVWRALLNLVQAGIVSQLGASVQTPDEFVRVLREPRITVIQMPFNILDGRWRLAIEAMLEARRERKIVIHIRSVFLQGLLLMSESNLWDRTNCDNPGQIVGWLNERAELCGRDSVADLCLAYVRSQTWADGIVVGMETVSQLEDNIRLFKMPKMTPKEMENIDKTRPQLRETTLNPALWSTG